MFVPPQVAASQRKEGSLQALAVVSRVWRCQGLWHGDREAGGSWGVSAASPLLLEGRAVSFRPLAWPWLYPWAKVTQLGLHGRSPIRAGPHLP